LPVDPNSCGSSKFEPSMISKSFGTLSRSIPGRPSVAMAGLVEKKSSVSTTPRSVNRHEMVSVPAPPW
jgi:hypothetical protein